MIIKNIPNNFKSETEKSHSVDLDLLLLPVQMTPLPHTLALYLSEVTHSWEKGRFWLTMVSHSNTHVFKESRYVNCVAHKLFIHWRCRRPCILGEVWKLPVMSPSRSPWHPVKLTGHRHYLRNTSWTYHFLPALCHALVPPPPYCSSLQVPSAHPLTAPQATHCARHAQVCYLLPKILPQVSRAPPSRRSNSLREETSFSSLLYLDD